MKEYHVSDASKQVGTLRVKTGLAEMLKGGVIMDVVNPEQAKIAEDAGAVAVMALERVPADIRAEGGVSRMSDPTMVEGIVAAVTIPVMAKCRIGHFVEAQILQSLGVDYIDESEVLTPADEEYHINKLDFTVPFVCGCRNLGEALRRIAEGAAMVRTKGEPGTGNVVEAVRHMRAVTTEIGWVVGLRGIGESVAARVVHDDVVVGGELGCEVGPAESVVGGAVGHDEDGLVAAGAPVMDSDAVGHDIALFPARGRSG
jgi:pyridoxal 5'-phosphate synthase subunit Pdx1